MSAQMPSPRERLEAVERSLRVQRAVTGVACLVSAGALSMAVMGVQSTQPAAPSARLVVHNDAEPEESPPPVNETVLDELQERVVALESKPERFLMQEWDADALRAVLNPRQYGFAEAPRMYQVVEHNGRYVRHEDTPQGRFEFGKQVGPWVVLGETMTGENHPLGPGHVFRRSVGDYRDGERVGPWKFYADRDGKQLVWEQTYD